MNSLILRVGSRMVCPLLALVGLALMVRGHDSPGGGFAGGLLVATALILHGYSFGIGAVRRMIFLKFQQLMGLGFLISASALFWPMAFGDLFGRGYWVTIPLGPLGSPKVGTPILFDVGVFLLVMGMVLEVIKTVQAEELAEEERQAGVGAS